MKARLFGGLFENHARVGYFFPCLRGRTDLN